MDNTQELSGRALDRRVADIKARERALGERVLTGLASLAWSTDDALAAELRREMYEARVEIRTHRQYNGFYLHAEINEINENWFCELVADAEAEATARAYVYWKEQTAKAVEEE